MNDIQSIREKALEKSRILQKQYNINNRVDKLAEIQENIEKTEQQKKRQYKKRSTSKSISKPQSTRRSKRLKGEDADLSNISINFLERSNGTLIASDTPKKEHKRGTLIIDADKFITIDDIEISENSVPISSKDLEITKDFKLEMVGGLNRITKHRISDMSMHKSNLCAIGNKEGEIVLYKFDNQVQGSDDIELSRLDIHNANISHVSFSDNCLISASYDNLRMTDLKSLKSDELVKEYKISAVLPVDNAIYYAGTEGKVHLRDLKSSRSTRVLAVEEGKKINTLDIRGNLLLLSGLHRKAQLFDLRNTSEVVSEFKHGYSVNSAYFNSDGSQIISTSYDDYLRLFNTASLSSGPALKRVHDCQTGKWVSKFKAKFDGSNDLIYCADKSRKINFYSVKNMKLIYSVNDFTAIPAIVCARKNWSWYQPDYLITGNGSGSCQILQSIKSE